MTHAHTSRSRHARGGHARLTGEEHGGHRNGNSTRRQTTASYGEGEVAAHLGVLADDVDHPGADGDEPDGVGEEEVQRRASTARARFAAPTPDLQVGDGEIELQEDADERTATDFMERRRIAPLTLGHGGNRGGSSG